MWRGPAAGLGPGVAEVRRAGRVYTAPPRRADPHLARRPRGRAQAAHRPLCRSQGLDGGARRRGSRGGPEPPRPRPRPHDGGRPSLRGHGEPGDGRRHHGAVRGSDHPRGSRCPGVLRRAPHAGGLRALRRWRAPVHGRPAADAGRPQLRGGRRALDRQRPAHGLQRGGTDDPPGGADGAARDAGIHPDRPRDPGARRGVHPRAGARTDGSQGARQPGRGI